MDKTKGMDTNPPVYTKESLAKWADKIDDRLGPISGRDADNLAVLLRATAAYVGRLQKDRADGDLAVRDAIRETAATADELAFWRYQAIFGRACMLNPHTMSRPLPEDSPAWKEATRQLDEARTLENRERIAGVDHPKEPLT